MAGINLDSVQPTLSFGVRRKKIDAYLKLKQNVKAEPNKSLRNCAAEKPRFLKSPLAPATPQESVSLFSFSTLLHALGNIAGPRCICIYYLGEGLTPGPLVSVAAPAGPRALKARRALAKTPAMIFSVAEVQPSGAARVGAGFVPGTILTIL